MKWLEFRVFGSVPSTLPEQSAVTVGVGVSVPVTVTVSVLGVVVIGLSNGHNVGQHRSGSTSG